MEDNKFYAVIWLCVTVMVCTVAGSVLYYNLEKPTQYELMERLADKGYSPAVLKCSFSDNWGQVGNYEICKQILVDDNLTPEEAENLIKGIE